MRGRIFYLIVLVVLMSSCRKELCYNHDDHSPGVRVEFATTWELVWERDYGCGWQNCWNQEWGCDYGDLCPCVPAGLRVVTYHESGKNNEHNIEPTGRKVVLGEEGEYRFLLYNNNTEYIVYDGLSSSEDATATTRTRSRDNFKSPNEGERIMNQPDMLFGRHVESFYVERKVGTEKIELEMRPLVYTYLVRMEFSQGYEYVFKANGVMAGMAEKVYLYDGHTGPESASIIFECKQGENCLSANVMTFGVPDYPGDHYVKGDEDGDYMIRLEVLMTNEKVKIFDIDISSQMKNQPRGGVIEIKGLEITDEEAKKPEIGGGGFGVGVDGWGDSVDIDLPLT